MAIFVKDGGYGTSHLNQPNYEHISNDDGFRRSWRDRELVATCVCHQMSWIPDEKWLIY